ncbi:MAG: hypothetical protein ACFFD1_01050 [Candidatus Thorarchaeota archaeon]
MRAEGETTWVVAHRDDDRTPWVFLAGADDLQGALALFEDCLRPIVAVMRGNRQIHDEFRPWYDNRPRYLVDRRDLSDKPIPLSVSRAVMAFDHYFQEGAK